jgi:hypothetical protein
MDPVSTSVIVNTCRKAWYGNDMCIWRGLGDEMHGTPVAARALATRCQSLPVIGREDRPLARIGTRTVDGATSSLSGTPTSMRQSGRNGHVRWWAREGSNLQPTDYESAALTLELRARSSRATVHIPGIGDMVVPREAR